MASCGSMVEGSPCRGTPLSAVVQKPKCCKLIVVEGSRRPRV